MSDNIQNEINKLIANTDKMQEFWLGVIKKYHSQNREAAGEGSK